MKWSNLGIQISQLEPLHRITGRMNILNTCAPFVFCSKHSVAQARSLVSKRGGGFVLIGAIFRPRKFGFLGGSRGMLPLEIFEKCGSLRRQFVHFDRFTLKCIWKVSSLFLSSSTVWMGLNTWPSTKSTITMRMSRFVIIVPDTRINIFWNYFSLNTRYFFYKNQQILAEPGVVLNFFHTFA